MQVENFECQIAQAQIGNFLSGSGLSDDAMQQLEEHIAGCPDCKAALAAKRNELKAMLTQDQVAIDPKDVFAETEEQKSAKSIAAALRKKTIKQLTTQTETPVAAVTAVAIEPEPAPVAKAAKPSSYWKPLAYSLALGAVLVGMSLFSNNLSSIFGPKLSESKNLVASNSNETVKPAETNPVNTATPVTNTPATKTPAETTTTPETTKPETTPVTDTPKDSEPSLGSTAGALTTTQFSPSEDKTADVKPAETTKPTATTQPQTTAPVKPQTTAPVKPAPTKTVTPPVTKPNPAPAKKPVVAAKTQVAPKTIKKSAHRKRTLHRTRGHRAAAKHGITVYQP